MWYSHGERNMDIGNKSVQGMYRWRDIYRVSKKKKKKPMWKVVRKQNKKAIAVKKGRKKKRNLPKMTIALKKGK